MKKLKLKNLFSKKRKEQNETAESGVGANAEEPLPPPDEDEDEDSEGTDEESEVGHGVVPIIAGKMYEDGRGDGATSVSQGGELYPPLENEKQKLKDETGDWTSPVTITSEPSARGSRNGLPLDQIDVGNLKLSDFSNHNTKSHGTDFQQTIIKELWPNSPMHLPSNSGTPFNSKLEIETATAGSSLKPDPRSPPNPSVNAGHSSFSSSFGGLAQEGVEAESTAGKVAVILAESGYSREQIVQANQYLDWLKHSGNGNSWQQQTKSPPAYPPPAPPVFAQTPPAVLAPSINMGHFHPYGLGGRQYQVGGNVPHPSEHLSAWGYSPRFTEVPGRRVVCNSDDERINKFIGIRPSNENASYFTVPIKPKEASSHSSTKQKKGRDRRHKFDESESNEDVLADADEKKKKKKKSNKENKSSAEGKRKEKSKTKHSSSKSNAKLPDSITEIRKLGSLGRYEKLDSKDERYKMIAKYCKNSHGLKDSEATVKVNSIYQFNSDENKSNASGGKGSPSTSKSGPNIKLVFCKTNDRSVAKLAEGKDGAVAFYDRVARALACDPRELDEPFRQFVVLCSINVGDVRKDKKGYRDWNKKHPSNSDSVCGIGRLIPEAWDCMKDGHAIVPFGITVENGEYKHYELDYNEYIVYEARRIKVKYAVDIEVIPVIDESDEESESTSEESKSSDEDKKKKSRGR